MASAVSMTFPPIYLGLMAERNYSSFLSGSLGKGFSIGFRGSI
jgi:hypothetical protein